MSLVESIPAGWHMAQRNRERLRMAAGKSKGDSGSATACGVCTEWRLGGKRGSCKHAATEEEEV